MVDGVPMTIFNDLNTTAWATTLVTVVACPLIAIADMLAKNKQRSARSGVRYFLLLAGFCWCGILGLNTLNNASSASHASITGKLHVVGYTYGGRGPGISLYLVCVADCSSTSVPLIMEPSAESIVKAHKDSAALQIGYLVEYQKVRADVSAFKVVDISDPATGASFYHIDTAPHVVRASFFFGDAVLFLLTGLFIVFLIRPERSYR